MPKKSGYKSTKKAMAPRPPRKDGDKKKGTKKTTKKC